MAEGCYTSKRGDMLPITPKAECTFTRGNGGRLTLVHDLCSAKIVEGGETIARVEGMVGGGIQICDERDGSTWQISALDLFKALDQAKAFAAYEHVRANYHGEKQQ